MLRYVLALFALCSMAAAGEITYFFGETDVIGQRFVLDSVNGEKFSSPREVFIEFPERGKIAGRICNAFRGNCAIERYLLTADIASTRMLCPDPQLRQVENDFFNGMRAGLDFRRAGDLLEFRRDALSFVFRLAADAGGDKPSAPAAVAAADLEGKKFVIEKANGEDFVLAAGVLPFIRFDKDLRISGRACNTFTGTGELTEGTLRMQRGASTEMLCINPLLGTYERDLYALLQSGAAISLAGDTLTLSGNGQVYQYKQEQ